MTLTIQTTFTVEDTQMFLGSDESIKAQVEKHATQMRDKISLKELTLDEFQKVRMHIEPFDENGSIVSGQMWFFVGRGNQTTSD